MGYLSQKKHQRRVTIFLNAAVVLMFLFTVCILFCSGGGFYHHFIDYYFQYYILMLVLFIYAIYVKHFWHASLMMCLIILNFFRIGPYANLFFNISGRGNDTLSIIYQNNLNNIAQSLDVARRHNVEVIALNSAQSLPYTYDYTYKLINTEDRVDNSFIFSSIPSEKGGKVRFTPNVEASYRNISKHGKEILLLNINFPSSQNDTEEKMLYDNLAEFVLEQNVPVVIVGNFGLPSWSERFYKFLDKTDLEVKNRIILSDGTAYFNPLSSPSLNLLGYKALGVKNIDFLPKEDNSGYPILFELRL